MKAFRFLCLTLVLTMFATSTFAQEFQAEVRIVSNNNNTIDPAFYRSLEKSISDFLNNTRWTEDEFSVQERIKVNIQFTVTQEDNANTFTADVVVKSLRPVYNSTYETVMLNFIDKGLTVNYNIGQPIQRSEVNFYDNLSSSLTFYANMILGYDYDSYSLFGGEKFFQSAFEVYNSLSSSIQNGDIGWVKSTRNGRNKYWLIENILNPRLRPFRQVLYEYHRKGLDLMADDPDRQRAVMVSTLSILDEVVASYPNCMAMQLFSDAKRQELVDIFKVGDKGQKSKVYNLAVQLDPAQIDKYNDLK